MVKKTSKGQNGEGEIMKKGHKVKSNKRRMGQNFGWEIMTNGKNVECN
jgi:hypothetical protein